MIHAWLVRRLGHRAAGVVSACLYGVALAAILYFWDLPAPALTYLHF